MKNIVLAQLKGIKEQFASVPMDLRIQYIGKQLRGFEAENKGIWATKLEVFATDLKNNTITMEELLDLQDAMDVERSKYFFAECSEEEVDKLWKLVIVRIYMLVSNCDALKMERICRLLEKVLESDCLVAQYAMLRYVLQLASE